MMRFVLVFALLVPLFISPAQDKRPISAVDLWNLARLSSVTLSPDGSTAALVVSKTNIKTNKVNGDIYLIPVNGGEARQFTTGKNTEGSPAWSPDGSKIAFVTKREDDKKSQIYIIDVKGGEAKQLTDLPMGASSPKWFPDGKRIAFVSRILPQYGDDFDSLKAEMKRRKDDKVSARITEDRLFRYWDHYITDGYLSHIFSIDLASEEITDLTPKMDRHFSYNGGVGFDISPDGKTMLATALTEGPPYYNLFSDIYEIMADGSGDMRNITEENTADDFSARYSPDGKYMIYGKQISQIRNAERVRMMRRDLATGEEIELCRDFDRSPSSWKISKDMKTVYITAGDRAKTSIFSVPFSGGAVSEILRSGTNSNIELTGNSIVFLHQSLKGPNTLHRINSDGTGLTKLSHFNDALLSELQMGDYEDVTFKGARGDDVQMYITYPPNFDPDQKWPLLVLVHGGPHGTFGDNFHPRWNVQVFAAPGYVCVTPNFHGSATFGEEFAECINGAHAEMPFVDVMAATDYMAKKSYIDPARMAAAGGSYGGYLSAWIGCHTDRFACLINHAGVYNLMAQFGSDITHNRDISYGGTPWAAPEEVLEWSPSHHSKNYVTPTLVMHGERDYRVPYGQGLELYGTLKAKGVPARLVVYPDENHWILTANNSIHWYGEYHKWLNRWVGVGGE
jgi:dipeptidyl aminopeptidase/acylaminoacyl peptidase